MTESGRQRFPGLARPGSFDGRWYLHHSQFTQSLSESFLVGLGEVAFKVAASVDPNISVPSELAIEFDPELFTPELLLHPGWLALIVAAISILSKEAIYHYTLRAATRLRSICCAPMPGIVARTRYPRSSYLSACWDRWPA